MLEAMSTLRITVVLTAALLPAAAFAQLQPTVGPQVRLDVGGGTEAANETTISVSEANPDEIIAGWNDWRLSTSNEIINAGVALSLDAGATWTDFLLRPPGPNQSVVEGDPMTAFDPRTGTIWAGAITFSAGSNSGIYVARKDPGNPNFEPSVMAITSSGTDKCWMAAGPRPGMPNTTRLYVAFNFGVIWSDDMGDTWTSPVSLGSGIGFLPRVGADGNLYVGYWDFGTGMILKRSTNGGASFTTHTIATRMDVWGTQDGSRFPGQFRVPTFVGLDVDRNDPTRLYAMYFDTTNVVSGQRNVDLYFTTSGDSGTTWSTPVVINTDANPPGDQFFSWLEADKDGRLHVVFFDSRNTVQNDNTVNGMFDAYYAYSVNGGATWTEHRLSPNSWNSNNDGLNRSNQFIGDYLGLSVANRRAYPAYLDTSAGDTDIFTNIIEIPVPGDTNGDGVVTILDLINVIGSWGVCNPVPCDADIDGNGVIDFQDVLAILGFWT